MCEVAPGGWVEAAQWRLWVREDAAEAERVRAAFQLQIAPATPTMSTPATTPATTPCASAAAAAATAAAAAAAAASLPPSRDPAQPSPPPIQLPPSPRASALALEHAPAALVAAAAAAAAAAAGAAESWQGPSSRDSTSSSAVATVAAIALGHACAGADASSADDTPAVLLSHPSKGAVTGTRARSSGAVGRADLVGQFASAANSLVMEVSPPLSPLSPPLSPLSPLRHFAPAVVLTSAPSTPPSAARLLRQTRRFLSSDDELMDSRCRDAPPFGASQGPSPLRLPAAPPLHVLLAQLGYEREGSPLRGAHGSARDGAGGARDWSRLSSQEVAVYVGSPSAVGAPFELPPTVRDASAADAARRGTDASLAATEPAGHQHLLATSSRF
jgi:hypothetical protein